MARFIVYMLEDDNAWNNLPKERRDELLEKYKDWVKELRDHKRFVAGEPIAAGGRVLKLENGNVVDHPFRQRKAVITGFFIIEAEGEEHAVQIAKDCPALLHGECVIVRRIPEPGEDH